ncbi:MAG TPA: response regulator [Bacteroidales bacterium]|nr:response regulator [Bacteroidales bacterium]
MKIVERKKVLIVDDNEINILLLCEMLNDYGIETLTAFSGKEALEQINASSPDMVISDFMMPGMDGLELLSEIKRNFMNINLPIILLSAYKDEGLRQKALRLGAEEFIYKPLDNIALREKIISRL